MNTQQKTLLGIVLLVAVLGSGIAFYNNKSSEEAYINMPSVTTSNDNSNSNIASAQTSAGTINTKLVATNTNTSKKLSYSTAYNVPDHNVNTITVNITLKNGVISDITHTEVDKDDTSKMVYVSFTKNLDKSKIIGKKISEVSLSKVGGASLTTKAFM